MPSTSSERTGRPADSDALSIDERTLCGEDERSDHDRRSSELSDDEHDILNSEDERERLLTKQDGISGLFTKTKVRIGKRGQETRSGSKQRHGRSEETSALMYEMEEGVGNSDASLGRHSSHSEGPRFPGSTKRKSRRSSFWRRLAIYLAVAVLFFVFLAIAYRVSRPSSKPSSATMKSNGTSLFAPTTILISLDGFRADFLYRGLTPTLNKFIENGISPKYMLPSFPSVTFPNHYTMATGLYPEAHGVVGNTFWDPSLQKEFYYTDPARSMQPHWWGGEPLWVTAEKQNIRAAVHMWPGSEAHIGHIEPTHLDKYNGTEELPLKVKRVLEFLDLPGPLDPGARADSPRPQLIAAYVPNVDGDGHKYGPNSTEIRETIKKADDMLASILEGLEQRNLTEIVNVVVVSDHGMATTDVDRLIQLEDLVNPDDLEHIDGWPLYGLRPKKADDLDRLHRRLLEKAKGNPNIEVYLRDKDMPERYHFSKNERIAPLWIIPKTGWAIVDKSEFDIAEGKKNGDVYHPRGLHGYDFEHPLMRAIFVARGPAFPHKANSRVQPFQNIELYNIICDSIGAEPAANNGTLRLPLKPVGLHSDPENLPNEVPADPVETSASLATTSWSLATTSLGSLASLIASASGMEDALTSSNGMESVSTSTSAPPSSSSAAEESWWEWLTHKADNIEEWVDEFLHKHVSDGGKGSDQASS